jgi:hypothetical protein
VRDACRHVRILGDWFERVKDLCVHSR